MSFLKKEISTTKGLIAIFGAAVVLFGGAFTYYYRTAPTIYDYEVQSSVAVKKATKTTAIDETSPTKTNKFKELVSTGPSIFYTSVSLSERHATTWKASLYDLKSKKSNSTTLSIPENLTYGQFESAYSNNAVQWSRDGKLMAYSYGDAGGMDTPENPLSYTLELADFTVGDSVKVLEKLEVAQIAKWLLAPDGKAIYYLKADSAKEDAAYTLFKYDTNAKTHEKLSDDVSEYGRSSTSMKLVNNTIILLKTKDSDKHKKLYAYQYSIADKKGYEKVLYEETGTSFVSETDFVMSPNGNYLAFRTNPQVEAKIKIVNLNDASISEVVDVGKEKSTNHLIWSNESKYLAFETTPYGAGNNDEADYELYRVEIGSKEKVLLETNKQKNGGIQTVKWSPDDKYLLYMKGKSIRFYDFASGSSVEVYNENSGEGLFLQPKGIEWVGFN